MPFLQVNVEQEIQKQRENDPEFKKIWDESRAEKNYTKGISFADRE